jgi:hypothetical protein
LPRAIPILLTLCLAGAAAAAPTATVADGKIVIAGVPSAKGLSVVVAEGTEADIAARPPVAGEWITADGKVVFKPKYPFKAGTAYRVVGTANRLEVRTPRTEAGKPTVITHVYPSSNELPENVLRFYVEFNQPMPRGDVYKYVKVVDDAGKRDPQPFVELDQELWNVDQTRLTLLIDPGRIKKEVKPRIDLGPVFRAGKKYTLVVSGKWPTLESGTLGKDLTRAITIAPPVADAIDPKAWKLTAPADASATLRVSFGRPLDRVLLARSLTVLGPGGQTVAGTGESIDSETAWTFRPERPWASGNHVLRVDASLEDVCGNAVGRPFEVDLLRPAPKTVKAGDVDLPFTVSRR